MYEETEIDCVFKLIQEMQSEHLIGILRVQEQNVTDIKACDLALFAGALAGNF